MRIFTLGGLRLIGQPFHILMKLRKVQIYLGWNTSDGIPSPCITGEKALLYSQMPWRWQALHRRPWWTTHWSIEWNSWLMVHPNLIVSWLWRQWPAFHLKLSAMVRTSKNACAMQALALIRDGTLSWICGSCNPEENQNLKHGWCYRWSTNVVKKISCINQLPYANLAPGILILIESKTLCPTGGNVWLRKIAYVSLIFHATPITDRSHHAVAPLSIAG